MVGLQLQEEANGRILGMRLASICTIQFLPMYNLHISSMPSRQLWQGPEEALVDLSSPPYFSLGLISVYRGTCLMLILGVTNNGLEKDRHRQIPRLTQILDSCLVDEKTCMCMQLNKIVYLYLSRESDMHHNKNLSSPYNKGVAQSIPPSVMLFLSSQVVP